jgi:hypothetical protein
MYKSVVGKKVGISKTGPAVEFIRLALLKCGVHLTGTAIAGALARRRRAGLI